MEEENELLAPSEAPRAPAQDPGEGMSTPAAGPNTYIGPTSSMLSLTMHNEHVSLPADEQQVCAEDLFEYATSCDVRRTCLSMRRAASMLRACCDCFYCASAGADLAPDATVRARAAN